MNFIRKIDFTSAQNLLEDTNIKKAISDTLGLDAEGYSARLAANAVTGEKMGFLMAFDITMGTKVTLTLNDTDIDIAANETYSTKYPVEVWKLSLGSAASGSISMDIRR